MLAGVKAAASAYFAARVGHAARNAARAAVLLAIAGVLLLIGLLFVLFALYQYGAVQIGPVGAAASIGGGLIVLALVFVAIARTGNTPPPPAPRLDDALTRDITDALGLNDKQGRDKMLYQTLAAAAIAGFFAGRKLK